MPDRPHAEQLHQSIQKQLDQSLEALKIILNYPRNEDAQFREYRVGSMRVCAVYIEGMADEERIAEFVLHALKGGPNPLEAGASGDLDWIDEHLIEIVQTKRITENAEAVPAILSGMT